jgi:hypothetical protein
VIIDAGRQRRSSGLAESEHYRFAEDQTTVLGSTRLDVEIEDLGDEADPGPIVGIITQAS